MTKIATVVLSCETLRDELGYAMKATGLEYDVIYVKPVLHNNPDTMRSVLQAQIDALTEIDSLLMAFSACGNALVGLRSRNFQLVIPRVDDCISLLLGSIQAKQDINANGGTYFLTPGWLDGEHGLRSEYEHAVEKFGLPKAERILGTMLEHYRYLGLLDTGAHDIKKLRLQTTDLANKLKLEQRIIPASVSYLCDLLSGPWDNDRFLIVPPNSMVSDFSLQL
ncbi:MAG: DUF1638 domain-containing protein [Coriobacteriia bacterium]|nr:DUF1638 domain-containing protein [Coriobacteriia bacterium]